MAGEVFKTYLSCATKIIRSLEGDITSCDGDRVIAVFICDAQPTTSAKCALQINWAVRHVVNLLVAERIRNSGSP